CGKASSHISLELEKAIIIYLAAKERSAKKRHGNDPISATHERCGQRGCSSCVLESGDTTWIHRQCFLCWFRGFPDRLCRKASEDPTANAIDEGWL
ncbi:hypothetical protein MUK42_33092, partial [Musa troglodytarum]